MRLKNKRWLVEEQRRHIQEERKTSMREEQKCLPEERCKRTNEHNQLLNEEQEKLSDEDMEVTQAIEKVLVFKGEQVQMRNADQYAIAQSVVVEKKRKKYQLMWRGHRGERKGGEKEEGSEKDGESQQHDGVRETWQNEWDTDYVGDDRNKMVLTTKN
ncbi:hypothetical protein TNCV_349621 [Trichonephila clavipes]|nr:hypothetical protein TNCV_349621 [Trichonephila clavipes]